MVMFEERAYWNETQIADIADRFRKGVAGGSNEPSVSAMEAAALLSSGVLIPGTEIDLIRMQNPGLSRTG